MAIRHAAVKVHGERGYATEWNAGHVVDDDSKPKNFTTLIVAASNSLDTTRADYVCDGIDDQETIQEAIDALPAAGGRVSLQEGQFEITDTIDITNDNVSIEGLGPATILNNTVNQHTIDITNADNVVIKAVRIVGNNAGATQWGIQLAGCTDSTVRECWIEGMGGLAVDLIGSTGVTIADNFFFNNQTYNVNVAVGCDRCIVRGNVFRNTAPIATSYSIYALRPISLMAIGNVSGIRAVFDQTKKSIFSNNIFFAELGNGLALTGSNNITIVGNVITNSPGDNININVACNDCIVIGNQLIGAGGVGLNDNGVGTEAAHNIV